VDPGECLARGPSSTSVGLTDYSQVDIMGIWYTSVNFGAEKSPTLERKRDLPGESRGVPGECLSRGPVQRKHAWEDLLNKMARPLSTVKFCTKKNKHSFEGPSRRESRGSRRESVPRSRSSCSLLLWGLRFATKWLPKWLGCEPRLIVVSLDSWSLPP